MECPECSEYMNPICMSGNDEEITIEYHCEKCNTYAKLIWNPGKRLKQDLYTMEELTMD